MLMIIFVHFKRACITYQGQARFVRFIDRVNSSNIKNIKIEVLLELSSWELYFEKEIQSTIDNPICKLKDPLYFFISIYMFFNFNIVLLDDMVTKPVSIGGHHYL